MGFTLECLNEPILYWAGGTVYTDDVQPAIERVSPDVIVTHSCGALWDNQLIVMDAREMIASCRDAPKATVIATHMDALDHATVSRADLRAAAEQAGVAPQRLLIPQDGEELRLDVPAV